MPMIGGSAEVVQLKGATLKISKSGSLPVVLQLLFIGEGEMDMMTMSMKMAEQASKGAPKGTWQEVGASATLPPVSGLFVEGNSLKYVDGDGKTLFTEPASAVKAIQEMTMAGETTGIFRIVFNNGKSYNFTAAGEGTIEYLKKRLGK